jgi:predicted DNA-binding transcriptional regulator YafY
LIKGVVYMVDYVLKTSLEKHQEVTIIYQKGKDFSERKIKVTGIKDDTVEAYCYLRHKPRVFKKDKILSAQLYTH